MNKSKEKRYILMFEDYEVLLFSVSFDPNGIEVLEKREHFEMAPYQLTKENANLDGTLYTFFARRVIPVTRHGYDKIMEATGCRDSFELVFKGHGLSLSNHYWFKKEDENLKYEDINFFDNRWDDSFARALLNDDFEALRNVNLDVPDTLTQGWAVKGWISEEDGPRLYKLGIQDGHCEESLGEVLTSRLAKRLFKENEVLEYELREWNGRYASVSKPMIKKDEDLVHLSAMLPWSLYKLYRNKNMNKRFGKEFFEEINRSGMGDLYEFFVKLSCLRALCFVPDLHFDNIGIIRNLITKEIHPAPFYDLAGSFGGTMDGQKVLSNLNQGTYLIVYFLYGYLDPNWDLSWYDPSKLEGFEDEIRECLSKSSFYTPKLIDNIIEVYRNQKEAIDSLANKN